MRWEWRGGLPTPQRQHSRRDEEEECWGEKEEEEKGNENTNIESSAGLVWIKQVFFFLSFSFSFLCSIYS